MIKTSISKLALRLRIFLFQLGYSNRGIKARSHWQPFHPETRWLDRAGDNLSGKERMHSARGLLSFGNSVHDFAAAVGAIAAGEYLGQICLAGFTIVDDYAALIQFQRREKLPQQIHLFLLANGFDGHVEWLDPFRARQNLHFAIREQKQ